MRDRVTQPALHRFAFAAVLIGSTALAFGPQKGLRRPVEQPS
jgi:hypothetical protein